MHNRLQKISLLAAELFQKFGIEDWHFCFFRRWTWIGGCFYREKKIKFSIKYLRISWAEIKDTMLHEIAHALAYLRYGVKGCGHGKLWKKTCVEIGAEPKRVKEKVTWEIPERAERQMAWDF